MQFKSAKFFNYSHQNTTTMDTYTSKTGKTYPVFKLSESNDITRECIRKHLNVLDGGAVQSKMKATNTDRTLFSCRAQDNRNILLFIEKDSNNSITERFAVDLNK